MMADEAVKAEVPSSKDDDTAAAASSSGSVPTPPLDQETDVRNPWPHLQSFYNQVLDKVMVKTSEGRSLYKGTIKCARCSTNVRFSTKSTFTLKNHYKNVHPNDVEALKDAIRAGSKRGHYVANEGQEPRSKTFRKSSKLTHSGRFDQAKAAFFFERFMIGDMMPARLVDSKYFAEFLECLNPNFSLPSRQAYMLNVKNSFNELSNWLNALLSDVKYVATTADCWSAHNRSFLGMTVHWIDENSLKRCHAVLCCKELEVAHMFGVLADTIQQIHKSFNIENKVVSTITDNGSNFVNALGEFGEEQKLDNEDDTDVPLIPVEVMNIHNGLKEKNDSGLASSNLKQCCAYILNLLATSDVESVPGWSCGPSACFNKTRAKAQSFWNKHNSSNVFAESILSELGHQLFTPRSTSLNSLYDSFHDLSGLLQTKFTEINKICIANNIAPFAQIDKDVIKEFLLAMQPVSASLNKLQCGDDAYMGVLLPTLYVLRTKLEAIQRRTDLQYAHPLVFYLLDHPSSEEKHPKGFNGRFESFFSDIELLVASAIHPQFKLGVIARLNNELLPEVRQRLSEEIIKNIPQEHFVVEEMDDEDDDDFFEDLRATSSEDDQLSSLVTKAIDDWKFAKPMGKTPIQWESFPVFQRQAWVEVFIKYNTSFPCSAAIERIFSAGSNLLAPKRSNLSSESFERFVFIKENEKCVGSRLTVPVPK